MTACTYLVQVHSTMYYVLVRAWMLRMRGFFFRSDIFHVREGKRLSGRGCERVCFVSLRLRDLRLRLHSRLLQYELIRDILHHSSSTRLVSCACACGRFFLRGSVCFFRSLFYSYSHPAAKKDSLEEGALPRVYYYINICTQ